MVIRTAVKTCYENQGCQRYKQEREDFPHQRQKQTDDLRLSDIFQRDVMSADIGPPLRYWPGRRMRLSKVEK